MLSCSRKQGLWPKLTLFKLSSIIFQEVIFPNFSISQVTQVNQDMKALFVGTNKDKEVLGKELNTLETKFTEEKNKKEQLIDRKL